MIIEFWKTAENPITCYVSRKFSDGSTRTPTKKDYKKNTQSVIVESPNGEKEEYKSVVLASSAIGINVNTLYAVLNGRLKNQTEYIIYKSV